MKIDTFKCNSCDKITNDYYAEKGWIRLLGLETIQYFDGIDLSTNNPKYIEWNSIPEDDDNDYDDELDFCSKKCMRSFFNNIFDLPEA